MMPPRHYTIASVAVLAVLALTGVLAYALLLHRPPAHHYARPRDLAWFKDAKFGLMITWGPVSLLGTEIGWSRGGKRPGEDDSPASRGTVPPDEYDRLYLRFNPTQFDADQYVHLAQSAGAKYIVFVTKHHDGFCMFDSALTDYKITNAPIRRDLTAELAAACHRASLRLGFYYSPVDWHHPDYRTARHDRYISYLHGQIRELCTRYGQVDILWFDGLLWRPQDWDSDGLFRLARTLQPHVLINDRAAFPGDFSTLDTEQNIGEYGTKRPWETCLPLGNQWAYRPADKLKSAAECIRTLVRCAGAGGNFLLNISPDPTGRLDPAAPPRLEEIGRWLSANARSIYATRPGPFPPADWGVSTHRDDTVYVHVLQPAAHLSLPPLRRRILSASTLARQPVEFAQSPTKTTLTLPAAARDAPDFVVELRLRARPP